ncbi:MAG: YciI family protein [Rhizobium sp.]
MGEKVHVLRDLAYHEEGIVESWSKEEDAALMTELLEINDRLVAEKSLGPAARLGPTRGAVTLRGKGAGMVIDGPFAETKEQLLGFYVVDFPTLDAAVAAAREMRRANPTAVYEIRPVSLYLPGAPLKTGEGG